MYLHNPFIPRWEIPIIVQMVFGLMMILFENIRLYTKWHMYMYVISVNWNTVMMIHLSTHVYDLEIWV